MSTHQRCSISLGMMFFMLITLQISCALQPVKLTAFPEPLQVSDIKSTTDISLYIGSVNIMGLSNTISEVDKKKIKELFISHMTHTHFFRSVQDISMKTETNDDYIIIEAEVTPREEGNFNWWITWPAVYPMPLYWPLQMKKCTVSVMVKSTIYTKNGTPLITVMSNKKDEYRINFYGFFRACPAEDRLRKSYEGALQDIAAQIIKDEKILALKDIHERKALDRTTATQMSKAETLPADSIAPIDKPTVQSKPEITSIAPSKLLPPSLAYSYSIHDANNNRILDGDEEVTLKVEIENKGGLAKDVQVILTGNQTLISYLGEKRAIGDIRGGEKKIAEFKGILPPRIPATTAELSIEVKEGAGYSPAELKTFKVAMKPAHLKESVEIISEINVDDIPSKVKGYERKEDFAIVIGISDYREKSIPPVKYAKRDAEIMAGYLQNVGGIPKINIKVLTNEGATKSDLEAHIEDWLQRRVSERSTIFIYYAGHGTSDTQGRDAYIVPYEGHPDFPSKLYPLRKMYESLNKIPVRNVVVMLDSCFSGSGGRSVAKAGARPLVMSVEDPILAGGKLMVLAASTGTQISSDYDKAQHGLFTYYLLKGMLGEADIDRNGTIEIGELYKYTRANVSEKASIELNRDQTPILMPSAEIAGDRLKIPLAIIR